MVYSLKITPKILINLNLKFLYILTIKFTPVILKIDMIGICIKRCILEKHHVRILLINEKRIVSENLPYRNQIVE